MHNNATSWEIANISRLENGVENDASARPPNLISASFDLLTPKLIVSCPWPTDHLRQFISVSVGLSKMTSVSICIRKNSRISTNPRSHIRAPLVRNGFSSVGRTITDARARLSPSRVEAMEIVRWGCRAKLINLDY